MGSATELLMERTERGRGEDFMHPLYQKIILDHYRNPRNFGELPDACLTSEHENPMCGDSVKIMVRLCDNHLKIVRFQGHGCALSTASASIMSAYLEGKTIEEAREIIEGVLSAIKDKKEEALNKYGDMAAFKEVHRVPLRVQCVTLPWNALKDVLSQQGSQQPRPQGAGLVNKISGR